MGRMKIPITAVSTGIPVQRGIAIPFIINHQKIDYFGNRIIQKLYRLIYAGISSSNVI